MMPTRVDLSRALFGTTGTVRSVSDLSSGVTPSTQSTRYGTAVGDSVNGRVTVRLDGNVSDNTQEFDCQTPVKDGQRVIVININGYYLVQAMDEVVEQLNNVTNAVTGVDVEYGISQSPDTKPLSWSTTATLPGAGEYLWQRQKVTDAAGKVTYGEPSLIGAGTADGGAKTLTGVQEQYYLSTSQTTQAGGSWQDSQPAYVGGRYYWTRTKLTWSDGSVTYTTPQLARALTSANEQAWLTNQHFWTDTYGAHVTTAANSTSGINALIASNGFFVRNGTTMQSSLQADSVQLLGGTFRMGKSTFQGDQRVNLTYYGNYGGASIALSDGACTFESSDTFSMRTRYILVNEYATTNTNNYVPMSRFQGALNGTISKTITSEFTTNGSTQYTIPFTEAYGDGSSAGDWLKQQGNGFYLTKGFRYVLSVQICFFLNSGAGNFAGQIVLPGNSAAAEGYVYLDTVGRWGCLTLGPKLVESTTSGICYVRCWSSAGTRMGIPAYGPTFSVTPVGTPTSY